MKEYIDSEEKTHKHIYQVLEDSTQYFEGFYYSDETQQLSGPFNSLEECEMALERYGIHLEVENQFAKYESIIASLWDIIDDIDTYSDMAKGDDKAFRALTEKRQKARWDTGITCDGYTLDFSKIRIAK